MGDVERVGNEFIVGRQGVAKVHLYYIPKALLAIMMAVHYILMYQVIW
jgi:hypothetical protein